MGLSPPDIVRNSLAHLIKRSVSDPSLTPASVMVLLYPKDGDYCVLLNKRSEQVEYHKGEISFPGGARDPEDRDSLETALRETEEEMGIQRRDITVLGEMDEVETRSRFKVNVYVGTIPYPHQFKPSAVEIAEVLEVPIGALRNPANLRAETRWENGAPVTTHAYAHEGHLIFGATAKILQQFLQLLEDGQQTEAN